jgi:repressor LexA
LPAVQADFGYVRFEGPLTNPQELFALEVVGDSMVGDDIEHGDCVLIRRGELRDGQIGAVIYDEETTLKRVFRTSDGIRLEPSNPFYENTHIPLDDIRSCTILGQLEAVISRQSGHVRWISPKRLPVTQISLYLN